MPSESERAQPTILGGSLTRSPDGRLQTLQTHGLHTSPRNAQQAWSQMVRSRYPRAWDRQPLAAVGSAIEWSEQIQITCGLCRRSLGKYRSYHVHDEYGIVEDTPRSYEPSPGVRRSPGSRAPRSKPRYMIDGEIAGHAAKATARFHCPGCRADYDRNLARLGRELMELTEPRLTLHR